MDEMMIAPPASYLNRVCPLCGERFARHDPDWLEDGICAFTGQSLDADDEEVDDAAPTEAPPIYNRVDGEYKHYDPTAIERKAAEFDFYAERDGGTPARHNVRINAHFAAWLADENSAGRFPSVEEAGRQYDEKYT